MEGANTYIFTNYDAGVFDEVSKPYIQQATNLLNKPFEKDKTYTVDGVGRGVFVYKDGARTMLGVQNDKQFTRRAINTPQDLAKRIYQLKQFGKIV